MNNRALSFHAKMHQVSKSCAFPRESDCPSREIAPLNVLLLTVTFFTPNCTKRKIMCISTSFHRTTARFDAKSDKISCFVPFRLSSDPLVSRMQTSLRLIIVQLIFILLVCNLALAKPRAYMYGGRWMRMGKRNVDFVAKDWRQELEEPLFSNPIGAKNFYPYD